MSVLFTFKCVCMRWAISNRSADCKASISSIKSDKASTEG